MFVWRELSTSDVEGALKFYGGLVGWQSKRIEMPNGPYWLLHAGEKQVGGLMPIPDGADMPPYWMSYLSVDDVDAVMAKAKSLGGEPVWGPIDVPNVGRMGTVVDPRGAAFSVMRGANGDPLATVAPERGEFCWEELRTPDPKQAKAFYGQLAGWQSFPFKGSAMELLGFSEMPGETAASLVTVKAGERIGWNTFIAVDSLKASCERALELGGRVLSDRIGVPGIGSYSVVADPQGAVVCLFRG
jgi:predicted enzyme related to lactoylglutathione lyase